MKLFVPFVILGFWFWHPVEMHTPTQVVFDPPPVYYFPEQVSVLRNKPPEPVHSKPWIDEDGGFRPAYSN